MCFTFSNIQKIPSSKYITRALQGCVKWRRVGVAKQRSGGSQKQYGGGSATSVALEQLIDFAPTVVAFWSRSIVHLLPILITCIFFNSFST